MNRCVIGLQWGDEGKGKIVDILSEQADVVVRYSGGANAGHSVVRQENEKAFALHLLPSGILRDNCVCLIANGVVFDAEIILQELAGLAQRGITVKDNLKISGRAHLVMDYHKKQDRLSEAALGDNKIGTTIRGIGPCYGDKIARSTALRVADLLDLPRLKTKLEQIVPVKNKYFQAIYGDQEPLGVNELYQKCEIWAAALCDKIIDTTEYLHNAWHAGKNMLFEGAQGSLLDLDHGTFPFVTSSNCSALGLGPSTGLPTKAVDRFMGVVKAYTSRVGSGPFPTELNDPLGQYIRDKGHEYGTTTGRPRRCGWFDAVAVKYSIAIGGIDELAMLHLDTLAGLKEIKVCTSYTYQGKKITFFPAEADILEKVTCNYEVFPGFDEELTGITRYADLPLRAKTYVERLESLLGIPIKMVGVGPGREQTLHRE